MKSKETGIWKDIKLGLRLMRYSTNVKMNLVCSVAFVLLGIMMTLIGVNDNSWAGIYFLMPPILATQMIYVMNLSDMVRSSAMSKKMQLHIPTLFNLILTLAGYTVMLILLSASGYIGNSFFEPEEKRFNALLFMGFFGFCYLVYYAFAYKYMAVSSIVLFLAIIPIFAASMFGMMKRTETAALLPVPVIIVLGYVMILVGGVLCFYFSKLVYRKDFSRSAFRALNAQEMK